MPCLVSPRVSIQKNSHSLLTQCSKNSGNGLSILPGHFSLESVGPQKLLNIITKSPNQTLITEAAISEVLHLGVGLKTKSRNVSGNVLLLSVCCGPGCGPTLWKGCTRLLSCMQQQCRRKPGASGALVTAVLQEWKQSFPWLLTNLCHTFLLLVPYNWAHRAVMRNWMDRQVKQCSHMRSHPAAHYIELVQNVMCWHHGDTWIWIHSSPCLPHGSCR